MTNWESRRVLYLKEKGAVIPLELQRARDGTEHRKCNYKTSRAGNPEIQKNGVSSQVGAYALIVRIITVYSVRLAVVDGIFWEVGLRDLVGEDM